MEYKILNFPEAMKVAKIMKPLKVFFFSDFIHAIDTEESLIEKLVEVFPFQERSADEWMTWVWNSLVASNLNEIIRIYTQSFEVPNG